MNDASITLSADLLLGHERFARSIARGLLRNEHDAQDAVQDTWLRALQRGPRAIAALPAWLERVVRSRAFDQRRSEVARRRRERSVAVAADAGSADTAFEQLSVQHDVVAAVLALAEPYRSVVLLRYYHGLEPAEIATRLHAKAPTVRTQLVRAHELLREGLDRDHGRAAWAALAVPFAAVRPATPSAPALLAATIVTVALCVGAFMLWNAGEPAASATAVATATVVERDVDGAAAATQSPAAAVERELASSERQGPSGRTIPEVLGPRAALFDQLRHGSYPLSVFSFEYGFNGVQKNRKDKVRNDWDVWFTANRLRATMQNDDRSLLVDLGTVPLVALTRAPIDDLVKLVRAAAAKRPIKGAQAPDAGVEVRVGHAFFLWTNDRNSDLASLFEVVEFTPGDQCVLEWYSTEEGAWARGSLHSPRGDRTLAELATILRDAVRPDATIVGPKITLQARTGHLAGIPCRLDLAGTRSNHVYDEADAPILANPLDGNEQPSIFCTGGTVPEGTKFVITRAWWWGQVRGDLPSARFHAQIGDVELVNVGKTADVVRGEWTGHVEIGPMEEDKVFLEVANTSCGELVLEGKLESSEK